MKAKELEVTMKDGFDYHKNVDDFSIGDSGELVVEFDKDGGTVVTYAAGQWLKMRATLQ